MEIMSALNAKNRFGELMTAAQRAPVRIEKHGRPVAIVMSQAEFEELQEARRALLKAELRSGLDDIADGKTIDGASVLRLLREEIG